MTTAPLATKDQYFRDTYPVWPWLFDLEMLYDTLSPYEFYLYYIWMK